MKVKITVTMGLGGCKRERIVEIDDDMTDGEIDEMASGSIWEMVNLTWSKVEDKKGRSK